jgi:hypothetical protein
VHLWNIFELKCLRWKNPFKILKHNFSWTTALKKNVFANNQHLIEAFEITLFRIQFLLPKSKKKVLSKLFFLLSLRKVGNNSWVINYWEPLAFCCLNDFVASLNLMKRKLLFKFIFFLKIKKQHFVQLILLLQSSIDLFR